MKYIVSLILFLLLYADFGTAQETRRYTAIQGLSGTDVTAICENENFLWLVTNEGLCRFDGKEFKVYSLSCHKTSYSNDAKSRL